jgi:hypothetical protein
MIKAIKNGAPQIFTDRQWDVMGTDKYGWEIVPEIPKEVASMQNMRSEISDGGNETLKGRPGRKSK